MPFLESKKGGYPEKCRAISSFPLLLGGQIVDLGERLNGIQAVSGSIPLISTRKYENYMMEKDLNHMVLGLFSCFLFNRYPSVLYPHAVCARMIPE